MFLKDGDLGNKYFLNGYGTFVSYYVETFGNVPIPTYEECLRTFTRQEDRHSPHVLTEHPQRSQSYVSEPETSKASCSPEVPRQVLRIKLKHVIVG